MVIQRGEVWWALLGEPRGSEPGFNRPMVVVSSDSFNSSRIATVLCVPMSSNTELAKAPGNVLVAPGLSGLGRDSVVNVSQVITLDRFYLQEKLGRLSSEDMDSVDRGLRRSLDL
jgi:mRNA interferase MazF